MALITSPITLTEPEVAELDKKLSEMRHGINNHLSLIIAAVELLRIKPDSAASMAATLNEQPTKITNELRKFSIEFDRLLGINRE